MNEGFSKVKTTLLTVLMVAVIIACLVVYIFSTEDLTAKAKSRIGVYFNNEEQLSVLANTATQKHFESLQNEISELKTLLMDQKQDQDIKSKIEEPVNKQQKDDFSPILLTLITLENKLYFGGHVKNEITKLIGFSDKFPDIQGHFKPIEAIKELKSRDDLLLEFKSFAKNLKSSEIDQNEGLKSKILAFITKYFAILNKKNDKDSSILDAENLIQSGEFYLAFNELKKFENSFDDSDELLSDLKNSALVKRAMEEVYFDIAQKLATQIK